MRHNNITANAMNYANSVDINFEFIFIRGVLMFVEFLILFNHKFKNSTNILLPSIYVLPRVGNPRIYKSTKTHFFNRITKIGIHGFE